METTADELAIMRALKENLVADAIEEMCGAYERLAPLWVELFQQPEGEFDVMRALGNLLVRLQPFGAAMRRLAADPSIRTQYASFSEEERAQFIADALDVELQ
jgi:hypothetical protein